MTKSSKFNYKLPQSHACPTKVARPSHVAAAEPHLASVLQADSAGSPLQPFDFSVRHLKSAGPGIQKDLFLL